MAIPSSGPEATDKGSEGYFVNPSFEKGLLGWRLYIADESQNMHCTLMLSDLTPHTGVQCAMIHTEDFARCGIDGYPTVRVLPGQQFRVTVWVKAASEAW